VVLALARGRQRDASRPDGRVPVAGSIGVARAAAALLVALAAVVAVVLVLRAPARVPVSAPEGTLVAEGESTLVAPASPDGRTLEPIDVAGATAPDAPPAAAAPLLATVVVDVVGPDGPVAGAWVRVARDESPKGASVPMIKFGDDHETDRDGRAEFRVGDEQRVRFGAGEADALMVLVQAEGFEISDSQSVPFPESGTVAMTFRLTPASTIVRGRVTDEDGEPVEGALVSVGSSVDRQIDLGDGRSRVQRDPIKETRADGTFQHDGLPPGTLRLQVQHPGFSPHAAWISVMDGSATVHDVVLRRGSLVAGRVTTADGRPASGASVRAEFLAGGPELTVQEAVADDDGRFEVRGLAQAPTWLFAQHAEQSSLTAATHLEVEQQTTHEWNPVLEERPPLLLRVQREDGSPLSGALVALHTTAATESAAWQRFRATDAGGRVRFELVPATDLTAMVYRTLEDRDRGVPACHGQQGLHAAADEQALTVPAASLDRGGLCGVLLDQDGKPFDDAVLQIRSRPGPFFVPTPVSAETGEFEARNLPTQLYDVVVWCVGMGTVPLGPIEVFANDTFDLGEVSLPEPSSWSPSWPIPDSPAADAYELVKIDSLEDLSKRWTVTSGDAPPPPSFSLFPGKYEWNVYAKSQLVQSVTIEVR
jgi:hypothetical protein